MINFNHEWYVIWIVAAVIFIGLLCVAQLEKDLNPEGKEKENNRRFVARVAVLLMIPVALCGTMAYVFLPGLNNYTTRGYGAYGIPREQITDEGVQGWLAECETRVTGKESPACFGLLFDDGKEKSLLIYVDTEKSLKLEEERDYRGTHIFSLAAVRENGEEEGAADGGGYFLQAVMEYRGDVEIAVEIDGKEVPVRFTKIKEPLPQFYE